MVRPLRGSLIASARPDVASCQRCGTTLTVKQDSALHLCRECRRDTWYVKKVSR